MKKQITKWSFALLFFFQIVLGNFTFAQNAIVGTGFSTGWDNGSCNDNSNFKYLSSSTGTSWAVTTTATATGNSFFRLGVDWSGSKYSVSGAGAAGVPNAVLPNTTYTVNGACDITGTMVYNVPSTAYNYIFKTSAAGTSVGGNGFVFFEVQGAVQSVSSVSQSPVAASVVSGPVTVNATLSGALSTGQAVYIRYTNNAYSTSTVVQMTGSGTAYSASIPGNLVGANVSYYVFTSGTANVAANGSNADLYAINLNNNSGSNYTYTVGGANVIVTNPTNTTPNLAATYSTLNAAITALNATTAISGPVTITLGANEITPVGGYSITAAPTGASNTNRMTIQGSGATITAFTPQVSGTLTDAIFKIVGADFVTIQNFTMQENGSNATTAAGTNNMTEFGVALLYATATNGAQNNTIQNNTISLNRTYQNTFGIYSNSTHTATNATTSTTATTTAGGNSGLKIYGNTISNVNQGISITGPTAAADQNTGLDIGGTTASQGNSITNWGTTGTFSGYANVSGTLNGVLVRNCAGYNISYNTITSSAGGNTGTASQRAIYVPSYSNAPTTAIVCTINNNNISVQSGITTGTVNGIIVETTTGSATSSLTINTNNFSSMGHTVASPSGAHNYISNSMAHLNTTISNNTFTNLAPTTTGSVNFVANAISVPAANGSMNINSNSIVTAFNKTGAGGTVTFYTSNASSLTGSVINFQNNNISNITVTGATGFVGINNTDGGSPTKTITGNTFNNISGGTGAINPMFVNFMGGASSVSNNTVSNITWGAACVGITIGISSGGTTPTLNVSNNTVSNITLSAGAVTGITIGSPLTTTTLNVNGNTVSGLSSTAGVAVQGLLVTGAASPANIYNNTIFGLSGSNAGATIVGMGVSAGANQNIYANKIYDCNISGASTALPAVTGLLLSGTLGITVQAYNNLIGDLRAATANSADAIRGIAVTSTATSSNYRLYNNTIYLNASSSGATFGTTGIFHTANATTTTAALDLRNNMVFNTSTPNGTSVTTALRRSAAATLGNYSTLSNNNLYFVGTPSATRTILLDLTTPYSTMANFQTYVTSSREAASFTESTFVPASYFTSTIGSNTNYLKPLTTLVTQAESGGATIALTSPDYGGITRPASPGTFWDCGAWEFNATPLDLIAPTISYTAIPNSGCSATGATLSATISDPSGVNVTAGTKPRLYYKLSTETNGFAATNTSASNGWKYVEASNAVSPFTFAMDYSLLASAPTSGSTIQYFVAAQDNATTPNVGLNSGTFAAAPASVALTSGAFAIGGTINSFNILTSLPTTINIPADYPSITLAGGLFEAINNSSLSGNTIVNINANLTAETGLTSLNQIAYACGATYTLTIKPTGTTRTISGTCTGAALIKLNGADNVIIDGSQSFGTDRSLTITNSNTSTSATAIALISLGTGQGATNNTIKNCLISTGNTGLNNSYGIHLGGSTIPTAGADNDNITIQNNAFSVANIGIYVNGTAATSAGGVDNLLVTGNSIVVNSISLTVYGMQITNTLSSSITSNTLDIQTSGGTAPVGISLETGVSGTIVSKNNITRILATATGGYGGRGITLGTGSAASNITISNNMISGVNGSNWSNFGNSSSMGIAIGTVGNSATLSTTCGGINIYHNTIAMSGSMGAASTTAITTALYVGSGASALNVRNNIFSNTQVGTNTGQKNYAIYSVAANTAFTAIDYNDYFVSNTFNAASAVLGFLTSDRTNIAGMQAGFGGNTNSVNVAPSFTSASDLHLVIGSNPSLNNTGVTGTGIADDIDGDVRCPGGGCPGATANPDMGADEFSPPQDDAGVISFGSASFCPGTQTVQATVQNFGAATLNTFSVTWTMNGVSQGTVNFTAQNIASSATAVVTLGTFNFVGATNYVLVASTSLPNGNTDANAANDQFTSPTFQTGLSGTYTVGASGNYPTLTAAVAAANTNGLCGPTVFSLTDATYSGSETFPITVNQLQGSSSTNTLTIQPATGVNAIITGSNASAIVKLNGADFVTIDGSNSGGTTRNLSVINTNTGTASIFWLASTSVTDGTLNVTIKNCIITGNSSTTTGYGIISGGATIGSDAQSSGTNLTIVNNLITKLQIGIYARGTATMDGGLLINGNTLGSTSVVADKLGLRGIAFFNQNGAVISNNIINGVVTSTTGTASGIACGLAQSNSIIKNNRISDIKNTNTTGYGSNGIWLNSSSATSGLTVSNNFIYDIASYGYVTSAGTADNGYGMVADLGGGYKIYHNTVSLATNQTVSGNPAALNIVSTITGTLDIRNNIFSNTQTLGTNRFAIYSTAPNTSFTNINNNDYWVGTAPNLGFIGSNRAALTDIQTGFGGNANSVSSAPNFISASDLHLVAGTNPSLNNTGATGTGITDDIDGDVRCPGGGCPGATANPDMGADEFNPPQDDAGVISFGSASFCPGTQTVQATVQNFGAATLNTFSVTWSVNGASQGTVNFTAQNIASGATGIVTLGTFPFVGATNYVLVASTSLPNGNTDANAANDQFTTPTFQTGLSGTYTVGVSGNFATLTAAVASANTNGLCGPTVFSLTDATYSGSETFPIAINQLVGSSSTNTLTIRPATGVTAAISGSNAATLIRLNGADNIIIDGSNSGGTTRNLTITNTNTGTSSAVVWITSVASPADGATNNVVKNTIVNGNAPLTTFGGIISSGPTVGTAGATPNTNLTIQNNVLSSAQYGIAVVGATGGQNNTTITQNVIGNATDATTIGFVGLFGSNLNSSSITSNTISNIKGATSATGINLSTNVTNTTISSNTINGISATSSFAYGLNVGTGSNNLIIRNNTITNSTSTGVNAWGIRVGDVGTAVTVSALTIDKNIITNVVGATTGGYGGKGIDINVVSATSNISITNNMIAGMRGSGWNGATSSDLIVGIRLSGTTGGVNIYHNSVALNSGTFAGSASGTLSAALFLSTTTITGINLQNNILFTNLQNSGAAAAKTYSIYSASANTAFTSIDNNDYFIGGTQGVLGFISSDRVALSDIVTGFGSNANSLSVIPNFISATDLHLVTGTNLTLDNAGSLGTGISDDIDGDVRCPGGGCPGATTKPDIGADEFFVPPLDMAVTALVSPAASTQCFSNAETVTVTIQNLSGNTIDFSVDNVTVNVNVTGAVTQTLSVTLTSGTLAAGATQNVNMSTTLNMNTLGVYTFNAVTVLTGDGVPANNALSPAVTRTVAAPVAGTIASSTVSYCVTGGAPTLTLAGSSGGAIQWQESTTSNSGPWTNVGSGATTYTPGAAITATTFYQALVSCNSSSATATVVTVALNNPTVTSTTPDTVCVSGPVTLGAVGSAGTTLNWYATASSTTVLGTGTSFTTPSLTATSTYYVNASIAGAGTETFGRLTPADATGFATTNWGVLFNTSISTTLLSTTIYPDANGTVTISVQNSSGTEIAVTSPIAVTGNAGMTIPNVVSLNLAVPAGTGYRLIMKAYTGAANFRRDITGGSFPFSSSNFSVTNGWSGSSSGAYYWFYSIVAVSSCNSPRIPVIATVNPNPNAFTITPTAATTCENSVNTLTASTVANPAYVLGTATASSVAANTPFRQAVNAPNQSRVQYLITAAELNAVGISGAVNLNSLGFNVTTAGAGTMANYTISMANTALTALTSTYQTPTFTTVYSGTNILPVLGVNSFTFSTPFAWDGTSNILVNICHQGAGGTATTVDVYTPSVNMTTSGGGNNQCNLTTGGAVSANKPVMYITTAVSAAITWTTNVTGLFTNAGATTPYVNTNLGTVYSKPSTPGSYTYTATADYFGCTTTSTPITVVVNPKPTATITSSSANLCIGNNFPLTGNITASGAWTMTLSPSGTVTGTGSGPWSSTVVPTATTTYSVTNIVDALACPVGTLTGNTVLTLPVPTAALSPTDNATCVVKGSNWTHFYTSAGKLVVSIKGTSPTADFGSVTANSFVNADAQVTTACADPAATTFQTAVLGRSWYINPTNNLPATIRLPITNAEVTALIAKSATTAVNPNDDVFSIADINLSKYNGLNENGSWQDNCNPADSTSYATSNLYIPQLANGTISIANGFIETIAGSSFLEFSIPGFSEFWLMNSENATPLPVQLTSFTANCDKEEIVVKWSTATEQNSQSFIVERSRDLAIWEIVAEVDAAGNSSSELNYLVNDFDPISGISYYRMKQVDLDGIVKIYGPTSVSCAENENSMIVFPNPTKGNFTVEISSAENISDAQIQITDLTGKLINERSTNILEGKNQFTFEGLDLQLGTYIIHLKTVNGKINPVRVVVN